VLDGLRCYFTHSWRKYAKHIPPPNSKKAAPTERIPDHWRYPICHEPLSLGISGKSILATTSLVLIMLPRRLGLALALACTYAGATPRFEDYPSPAYAGKTAPARLVDAHSRNYATRLRAAAHDSPNFAGRYILTAWGCGASRLMAAAIDAKTGNVAWLPFTVCCWDSNITEPLEYHRDSRLLIVHGSRDEKGMGSETNFYLFNGTRFHPIR